MSSITSAISLTFGDVAENHKGMQKIGKLADKGFSFEELTAAKGWFEQRGCTCIMVELHNALPVEYNSVDTNAWFLIVKQAVNVLLDNENGANELFMEQNMLIKDTKAFMYGRVVNKHARHNLCFGEEHQEPDYAAGKGRIYAFSEVEWLDQVRSKLCCIFGEGEHAKLQAEGNYYYDTKKCGIGYHGDAERKKVIALRLGESIPLHFKWYHRNKEIGSETVKITNLEHGDMYIMSEKTTGYDWKSSSKCTLRHAAGSVKYVG